MRYRLHAVFIVLVQSAVLLLWGCSSKRDSNEFLVKAMRDGMWQIQTSHLALQKASDPDVKIFALRMIEDHDKIDRDIVDLAKTSGLRLPREISAEQQIKYDDMSKLSGRGFDKRYMQYNVDDHEEYVKDFGAQADRGSDAGVRALAARNLPVLKEHLQLAKGVYTKIQP